MKIEYPGLTQETLKSGKRRFRVRVRGQPGRTITLPIGPGEPGFDALFDAARAGRKLDPVKPQVAQRGTLRALCDGYLVHLEEMAVDKPQERSTLRSHRSLLKRVCDLKDEDGDDLGGSMQISLSKPSSTSRIPSARVRAPLTMQSRHCGRLIAWGRTGAIRKTRLSSKSRRCTRARVAPRLGVSAT